MIETKQLTKTFQSGAGPVTALRNIDIRVETGEFIAITGRSGSGKSTLLYQLGLLDHPTSGTIFIDSIATNDLSSHERTEFRLANLGYVFQDYAILPSLTAVENVSLPLLMQGAATSEAILASERALERVGLGNRLHSLPSQLSGGQQQRVAIARAIAHNPKIIFADEPTANLDSETSRAVLDAFIDLHKEGQTIIMVTHEDEYAHLANRIITLRDGEVVAVEKNS